MNTESRITCLVASRLCTCPTS